MENNDYGLLYGAAVAWKELTEYYYVFTFGYKQQLYTIHLSFPSEKVPHLAARVPAIIPTSMFEALFSVPVTVQGLAGLKKTDGVNW